MSDFENKMDKLTPNSQRTKELYEYLVGTLARMGNADQRAIGRALAGILDKKVKSDKTYLLDKLRDFKAITTAELVDYIEGIKKTLEASHETESLPMIMTQQEIWLALMKLVELTPEEQQRLGLKHGDEQILIQYAVVSIAGSRYLVDDTSTDHVNYERIVDFYRASIGLKVESDIPLKDYSNDEIKKTIKHIVDKQLLCYTSNKFSRKVLIEKFDLLSEIISNINWILLKAGAVQLQLHDVEGRQNYSRQYLPRHFVEKISETVIENKILKSEFPVSIKSIKLEKCGPLPLSINNDSVETRSSEFKSLSKDLSLLNANLLKLDKDDNNYIDLASQYAYKVTVDFYMDIPSKGFNNASMKTQEKLISKDKKGNKIINFSITSTGIGGTLSHITKVINRALILDICPPSIIETQDKKKTKKLEVNLRRDYFPIARDILTERRFPHSNMTSPLWAHSLSMICKNETVVNVMEQSRANAKLVLYADYSFGDRVGWGSYCGFDLLLSAANSTLLSRLRSIRYTGIAAQDYQQGLYDRIERTYLLNEARSYLSSYPFSSFAQERKLKTNLLKEIDQRPLNEEDSYRYYDAYLVMAETFLIEGAYFKAWPHLEKLEPSLSKPTDWFDYFGNGDVDIEPLRIFSGSRIVRFYLCKARYFYVVDRAAESAKIAKGEKPLLFDGVAKLSDEIKLHKELIKKSWESLDSAWKHLVTRLAKYSVINEVPQGIFHPHYQLLAQLFFLRAKLFIFFPNDVPTASKDLYRVPTDIRAVRQGHRQPDVIHSSRLYLLEKARLYIAGNGDSERYAYYTAYQCWVYLMASFSDKGVNLQSDTGNLIVSISRQSCQDWARRLRDHAILSYAKSGRRFYFQLKEKSGVSENLRKQRRIRADFEDEFGDCQIDAIPPIREIFGEEEPGLKNKVLHLDMSALAVMRHDLDVAGDGVGSDEGIYLFGTNSCYLFFARAMYHLCSDWREEFNNPSKKIDKKVNKDLFANSLEDWNKKLKWSYRLFSYAWAIADDGGTIKEENDTDDTKEYKLRLQRSFKKISDQGDFSDAASVMDLYPRRINEINDLGKVFAAACSVLQIYTITPKNSQKYISEVDKRKYEINWFIENLQRSKEENRQHYLGVEQKRYNGHMKEYWKRCEKLLRNEAIQAESVDTVDSDYVKTRREQLIKALFDAFIEP